MFSNAVKIGDLNDFIAPSQACVVQTGSNTDALKISVTDEPDGLVQLQPRSTPSGFKQTYSDKDNGPVKVTLHDCLACSGCVTSAETVLLQHQSIEELEQQLARPDVHVVVTVSPQSRASLAALHGIPAAEVQARLTAALHHLGAALVLDLGPAREMALEETAQEFLERYQRSKEASTSAPSSRQPTAATAARTGAAAAGRQLPMLASACPGWIVYAEKTHGEYILPYISTAKSPQAVMGTLVKRHLAASLGWHPAGVYHATIMPCYDKKLEAVREDYVVPGTTLPEVDCTLTTGELQQLLEQHGLGDLAAAAAAGPAGRLDTLAALLPGPSAAAGAAPAGGLDTVSAAPPVQAAAAAAGGGGRHQLVASRAAENSSNSGSRKRPSCDGAAGPVDGMEVDVVANGCSPGQQPAGSLESQQHGQQQQEVQQQQQQQQQHEPMLAAAGGACGSPCSCRGATQQQQQQQQQEELQQLHRQPGGSGGYMEHIFRTAAFQLFRVHLNSSGPLTTKVLRNADFQELSLQDSNGTVLLRFAAAYGFRNIQTLMRKIKLGRCEYDYVEVMACPGGCLNGAGQIKPREGQTAAQLLEQLEMLYYFPPESAAGAGGGVDDSMAAEDSSGAANGLAGTGQQQQQQQQDVTATSVRCEPGVITLLGQPGEVVAHSQQQQQQQQEGCEAGGGKHHVLGRSASVAGLYDSWVGDVPGSAAAKQLLHTQYRHRQKTAAAAVGDW